MPQHLLKSVANYRNDILSFGIQLGYQFVFTKTHQVVTILILVICILKYTGLLNYKYFIAQL